MARSRVWRPSKFASVTSRMRLRSLRSCCDASKRAPWPPRSLIVDDAVGMVELALGRLTERGIVDLDAVRKAAMISNLPVVHCSDQPVSPIVDTGSSY